MTEAPSHCSTCGVELIGGVRAADGVDPGRWQFIFGTCRDALRSHEWARFEDTEWIDPGIRHTSLQPGVGFRRTGREEFVANLKAIYDREEDFLFEILATRGRWCLFRFHAFGPGDHEVGPWEVGRLTVAGMDADGLWSRSEVYDETDIERARARLDELVAGESA